MKVSSPFINRVAESLRWLLNSTTASIHGMWPCDPSHLCAGCGYGYQCVHSCHFATHPSPQVLEVDDSWIKVREGCALPASLSHQGLSESSSKTRSRQLETCLGTVDDLGIFGACPSSQHSTVLCFSNFLAIGSKWSLLLSPPGKSAHAGIGMSLVHWGFEACCLQLV